MTNARAYYTTRAAAGASAPGIPHALRGRKIHANLGRIAQRDREALSSRHCKEPTGRANARPMTGSATKQSSFCLSAPKLDCFRLRSSSYGGHVASLAMTAKMLSLPNARRETSMVEKQLKRSRRNIMRAVAGGISAGLLRISQSKASEKMTREQAQYQDRPNGIYSCGLCTLFERPKSCKVVEGEVSEDGWCKAFALAD